MLLHASPHNDPIDLTSPHFRIGKSIQVYEDVGAKMDFSQIQKLPPSAFSPLHASVDAHLFTSSSFWYRFELLNPSNEPLERLIVIEIPWIDFIRATIISPDRSVHTYTTGNVFPYSQRSAQHRLCNVEHRFVPGYSTVYVQVKTRDPFIVPISVTDRLNLMIEDAKDSVLNGFVYGFIAAMLIYNLFLFLTIRAPYYAFYVLYLASFIIMTLSYNGYTFQLLFQNEPEIQNWMQSTTIFLFSISGLMFAKSFLNFKHYSTYINRISKALIYFYLIVMVLSVFAGYHIHVALSIAMSVFYSLYVVGVAIYSLVRGNRSAKFFLLGTMAGLVGTAITALTVMAVIPFTQTGFKAVDYGMIIDTILLSLALADRVRIAQEEKTLAEQEAKTDPLTRLPNRKAYYEITAKEIGRSLRYGNSLSLLMLDIDHFKAINDTYGHAAGDEVLRSFAKIFQEELRENDFIFRIGGEEFVFLLPGTKQEDAAKFAERLRIRIESTRIVFNEYEIDVTVSIGVAEYRQHERSIEPSETRADEALYRAKSAGRNRSSY